VNLQECAALTVVEYRGVRVMILDERQQPDGFFHRPGDRD
jgi:hypothetical protein